MIDNLREQYKQVDLLHAFSVKRSSYQYYRSVSSQPKLKREHLKAKVKEISVISRGSPGSRSISSKLKEQGYNVGRYKARKLMREANVQSKQPGKPKFKAANKSSQIANNVLNREFTVDALNQVWCGAVM